MALLLNIDTALETASVCLAEQGQSIALLQNNRQADHAAWIQTAIRQLFDETGKQPQQLDAVAVSNGPGSYTGLRVGLSTAKGLCYALKKPLITASTLEVMARSVKDTGDFLLCPMIDARRMEVYTALYTNKINIILPPAAMVLEMQSFATTLAENKVLFFGNGSEKFRSLCTHPSALFAHIETNAMHLAVLSFVMYMSASFTDLAYSEPFYCKAFYTTARN